jgi:hypothetical protein
VQAAGCRIKRIRRRHQAAGSWRSQSSAEQNSMLLLLLLVVPVPLGRHQRTAEMDGDS